MIKIFFAATSSQMAIATAYVPVGDGTVVKAATFVGTNALNRALESFPDAAVTPEIFPETVIVSRHAGAVEWLAKQGVAGSVIPHVSDPAQVADKAVIGALPLHLAAHARMIGSIDLPGLTAEQRGRDLTSAEMDAAGAALRWYVVEAL